jgi:hypothetical protein
VWGCFFFKDALGHHSELGFQFLHPQFGHCGRREGWKEKKQGDAEGHGSGETHAERGRGGGGSATSAERVQEAPALGCLRLGLHSLAILVVSGDDHTFLNWKLSVTSDDGV